MDTLQGARVFFIPPPLYYVAGLCTGVLLDLAVGWAIGGRPLTTYAGVVLLVAGLALCAGGVAGVVRHRTTIVPHHPVSALSALIPPVIGPNINAFGGYGVGEDRVRAALTEAAGR